MWGGPTRPAIVTTARPEGLRWGEKDSVWHRVRPPLGKPGNYRASAHQRRRDSPPNR